MAEQFGKGSERGIGMLLAIFEVVTRGVADVVGAEQAGQIGREAVDRVRHTFGGENVYVCKGVSLDTILKHNKIWSEFTGDNHVELAKKHGYSVQWIYEVVRTMNQLKTDEVQGDLFDSCKGKGTKDGGGHSLC
ncbi:MULTISPECIES: Mor transcription activator family protein [Pseudoalteromonas]|uniref:Mor transcription activator family protein n=1 Tax=Pseudoalteromonas TaxID=53246 RepID=UPI000BAE35FC|nr:MULTISPECIES: Mor transcription activator family protein [Pseudoalteromonas]NKC21609.1 transcriptional regulator [Pseudoalteromonas galatheae]PAY00171.1 transcriptional regulator [Pseudoalteromonas sp. HM-SA03]PHI35944.1 transcriptional regulator [Pseudoalteromonas sp. GCY]QQQ68578.1 transcriptional regulator [Pseudoalteromonas sp. GCY]